MRRLPFSFVLLTLAACATAPFVLRYPKTRKGTVVDDYHGTKVADPYRWLEDTNSEETARWVAAQNAQTFGFLATIPERDALRARLTELWDYERRGTPTARGGRWFYARNDGLQDQSIVYVRQGPDATPRVLLDPNELSDDGTVSLRSRSPSPDGRFYAYGVSRSGSDWIEIHVRDVATGVDLADHLRWVKFGGPNWLPDSSGFFYNRYDEPKEGLAYRGANYDQRVWFHAVGTPQAKDRLVYERPDDERLRFWAQPSEDGAWLVVHIFLSGAKNTVVYRDLQKGPDAPFLSLIAERDAGYYFAGNDGPILWFETTLDAPNRRVIAIDTRAPARANWTELIAERAQPLESLSLVGDRFVASYLDAAKTRVILYRTDGSVEKELALPGIGTARGFGGLRTAKETFYSFTSFTHPSSSYRYDFQTGESEPFFTPEVDFDPEAYVAEQVFYASKDGTRVPMFVVHKKGLALDGDNPCYLTGYGGFNISQRPYFSVANLVWLERGGVFAMPNLRGGGEFGEAWHEAGTKLEKQNVFDDFIAAAEWLIAQRYTKPAKLAIAGGSNGGLLVGACMTQRPELFGAALPAVGVMDMLRFHRFTIGHAWVSDYGSADDPAQFRALYAYSPYHKLEPGTAYPATLVTTADHDDRVVPGHSFKFAARLQECHAGPAPVLIRVETKAGHGGGTPTSKRIEQVADRYAFLLKCLTEPGTKLR